QMGMCHNCNGIGQKMGLDMEAAFDMDKSINEGAIILLEAQKDWTLDTIKASGFFDNDKKLKDFSAEELQNLYHLKPTKVKVKGINLTLEGVVDKFIRKYINTDLKSYSERTQKQVTPFVAMAPCEMCHGARLN